MQVVLARAWLLEVFQSESAKRGSVVVHLLAALLLPPCHLEPISGRLREVNRSEGVRLLECRCEGLSFLCDVVLQVNGVSASAQ